MEMHIKMQPSFATTNKYLHRRSSMIAEISGTTAVEWATRNANAEPVILNMPPDKSILHRLLIIGSLTRSLIIIPLPPIESIAHDVLATVLALQSLGVSIEFFDDRIELQGGGLHGLRESGHQIHCANSGTTARLLMGVLAGQRFSTTLTGDDSLSKRPMQRLAGILEEMGANIQTSAAGTLPARIEGATLHAATIALTVASAQMKTAVLLAGMFAAGTTTVREPFQSRDHTERMLSAFGAEILGEDELSIEGLTGFNLDERIVYNVPGDISSATFMIGAGILCGRTTRIDNLLLNPTRMRFLEVLTLMGVEVLAENVVEEWSESRGSLTVFALGATPLRPFHVLQEDIPDLIDELPMLAVLGAFADGVSTIEGAEELRHKESDRLAMLAKNLTMLGVSVTESKGGLSISGASDRMLRGGIMEHGGDHRIAMAFVVAALRSKDSISIPNAEVVQVSYPEFFDHLRLVAGVDRVKLIN
jgi:3-phosphoshikimate 1-carboxyvinyltransferase